MTQGSTNARALYIVLPKGSKASRNWSMPTPGQPGGWQEVSNSFLTECPAASWQDGASIFEVEVTGAIASDTTPARLIRRLRGQELAQVNIFTTGTHEVSTGVVAVSGDAELKATGDATVHASGKAQVSSFDKVTVYAQGDSNIKAYGFSTVHARGKSKVEGFDRTRVYACEETVIHANGRCQVDARANARVFAMDQSKVTGWDGATIRAFKRSGITAHGSCQVYTFDEAKAWLHDTVTAWADGTSLIFAGPDVLVHRKSAAAQVQSLTVPVGSV